MKSARITRRKRARIAIFGVVLTFATACAGAPPANAVTVFRTQFPIVAGTGLITPGGGMCTVGAVLKSTGLLSLLTSYQRAVRYIVMAKHCANYDGAELTLRNQDAARVIWRSSTDDLLIAKVEPSTRRNVVCTGVSQQHNCRIDIEATPRALGRVVLTTTMGERAAPVRGTAVPGADEHYCTSGVITEMDCNWTTVPIPAEGWDPGEVAAQNARGYTLSTGDSGGPVVGMGGQLYGIITKRGLNAYHDMMAYIPMARVFESIPHYYELAPA